MSKRSKTRGGLVRYKFVIVGIAGLMVITLMLVMNHQNKKPSVDYKNQAVSKNGTFDILEGEWRFMPGITKNDTGFFVHPTGVAIVNQNGSLSQQNPPLNLAGIHLEKVAGDFTMSTTISALDRGDLSLQLYGKVPIIADEFRIERDSVRITITTTSLQVTVFAGSGNTAVEEKTFPLAANETHKITLERKDKKLYFMSDSVQLGSVDESGIFNSGEIWFGLEAQKNTVSLSRLQLQPLNRGTATIADSSTIQITMHNPQGLQALAKEKRPEFIVGTAVSLGPIVSDPEYASVALDSSMFGSVTPENQMKMINLQPARDLYTFEQADALVHIARQNGLKVHGHALVFGEANPRWFTNLPVKTSEDKKQIAQIMHDYITKVVKHFGASVASWDVVNEPLADYDTFDSSTNHVFRNHTWYQAMGDSYILDALETAHQANPQALLFINEYGLEEDGERWDVFLKFMKQLVPQLQKRNVPIEQIGVGFQAHVYEPEDRINPVMLQNHMKELEKLGLKTQISEMDVTAELGDKAQANQYSDIFNLCLRLKNCIAWRGWILSDRYNFYKDDDGQIRNGHDGLFDTNMHPLAVKRMTADSK